MSSLTLLQIIQNASGELGLPVPATVIGNTDATTTQLFYLINRTLDEMRRDNRWTVMQTEFNLIVEVPIITTGDLGINSAVITNIPDTTDLEAQYWTVSANAVPQASRILSVDSSTQITMTMEAATTEAVTDASITFAKDTYELPTDIDWYNPATFWDRTNRWQLIGPDSPQTDQFNRSGIVAVGPRRHYRQIGPLTNRFRIWPAPAEISEPLQLVFEYLSNAAVAVSGSSTSFAQYFANDDDVPLLDSNALVMGIKYQFWRLKGMNYIPLQNEYTDYVDKLAARDGSAPSLSLSRIPRPYLIGPQNIQDGNYPSSPSSS